jgi:hypothetical protein
MMKSESKPNYEEAMERVSAWFQCELLDHINKGLIQERGHGWS